MAGTMKTCSACGYKVEASKFAAHMKMHRDGKKR